MVTSEAGLLGEEPGTYPSLQVALVAMVPPSGLDLRGLCFGGCLGV